MTPSTVGGPDDGDEQPADGCQGSDVARCAGDVTRGDLGEDEHERRARNQGPCD